MKGPQKKRIFTSLDGWNPSEKSVYKEKKERNSLETKKLRNILRKSSSEFHSVTRLLVVGLVLITYGSLTILFLP
jgi:uncharacterized membrane protein YraQ (UPF0718 family)